MKSNVKSLFALSFIFVMSSWFISSCGTGIVTNPTNGYLSVSYDGNSSIDNIQVTKGSTQTIYVSLKNSTDVIGQVVNISVSNTDVASISQNTCALSSGSALSSTCAIIINGLSLGSTSINVSSAGYSTLSVPTISQANPVFGTFKVESSDGNFYSGSVNIQYSATTKLINIRAGIFGSSGIESDNTGIPNFQITQGSTNLNPSTPNQCPNGLYSSTNPNIYTCSVPAWIVTTANSVIKFQGSIVGVLAAHDYPDVNVTATQAAVTPGKIAISTQSGNIVPIGMKAPIFVNWINASESGSVSLTLTSSNPSTILFYSYNESGIESTSSSVLCNLSTATESQLNCGFGVKQLTTSGSSVISAKITSQTGVNILNPDPLKLTVLAPEAAIRTMTFTNSSTIQPIWVGITQGGANAFTNPSPNGQSTNTTHDLSPGAVSMCGLSNPRAACPVGSTCRSGGANGGGALFCFWDRLEPVNGYKIESNGGSTTFDISASSRDPNGIIWSGNFFARTKCNESGVCEIGSCGNGTGLACAPGTGAAPGGVVTLGEFTFQKNNNPDYYDVSIINGVNFGVSFGPNQTTNPANTANAYTCGVAGSLESMANWPSNSSGGLPAASWTISPDSSSYPTA